MLYGGLKGAPSTWGRRLVLRCLALSFPVLCLLILGSVPARSAEMLLTGPGRSIALTVEIADTPETRRTGLMHRASLPPLSGMLFDYGRVQPVTMWMKNTLIPLDMLFADETGRIVHIHENARPGDLTVISSQQPVLAVLEVNAGFVQNHRVQKGDYLVYSIFDNEQAGAGAAPVK